MTRALVVFCVALLLACDEAERGPVKIAYGEDGCDACRMIISEAPHAAQMRLARKVEKYDDVGCLLERLAKGAAPVEMWVTDQKTGRWLDARSAFYSHSKDFKTPMASGLAAFGDRSDAESHASKYKGEVLSFEQIRSLSRPR